MRVSNLDTLRVALLMRKIEKKFHCEWPTCLSSRTSGTWTHCFHLACIFLAVDEARHCKLMSNKGGVPEDVANCVYLWKNPGYTSLSIYLLRIFTTVCTRDVLPPIELIQFTSSPTVVPLPRPKFSKSLSSFRLGLPPGKRPSIPTFALHLSIKALLQEGTLCLITFIRDLQLGGSYASRTAATFFFTSSGKSLI